MTGLREELEAVNVRPENLKEASTLREELEAGEQADRAWEVAKGEILGRVEGSRAALDIQGRDALEAEGLQRVAGEKKVEPFVEPTVEPLPIGEDGVIDLAIKPKSDAA